MGAWDGGDIVPGLQGDGVCFGVKVIKEDVAKGCESGLGVGPRGRSMADVLTCLAGRWGSANHLPAVLHISVRHWCVECCVRLHALGHALELVVQD